jgi:hypothetical protein
LDRLDPCRPAASSGKEAGKTSQEEAPPGKKRKGRKRGRIEREEREIELPKDLCIILGNCRDLSIKHNFPSIQNPNEEMPKMKVGEFFKLYNIALELKFKNSKLVSLHVKF